MGVIANIDYEHYPKQSDGITKPGTRVKVCYCYDVTKIHYGTIVRSDAEEPGETIIKTDSGRYLRAEECMYSIM